MASKIKVLIAAVIPLIFFCVHAVSTLLYNIPENPMTASYKPLVDKYMEPLFSQNWHLFAPEPATRMIKLWYRTKVNNSWRPWQDPMEPELKIHRHNRATYHAKLLYVYGNIAKDLTLRQAYIAENVGISLDSTTRQTNQTDSLKASPEYKLALRFVTSDIEKGYGKVSVIPDSLQLMLVQLYPKQFSERLSPKPFSYAQTIELVPDIFTPTKRK